MVFDKIKLNIEISDEEFNYIYPPRAHELAELHFTPIKVAKTAIKFLVVNERTKVLDIGSGVGKFCMIGASYSNAIFHGVEQRDWMTDLANLMSWERKISNVKFFNMNLLHFPIKEYDSIYFFNSFYENIDSFAKIDDSVPVGPNYYELYHNYLNSQLVLTKPKTRLATYWVNREDVPDVFVEIEAFYNDKLILWERKEYA